MQLSENNSHKGVCMLIKFTLENFLSFDGRISFSMLPGKGRLKKNHLNQSENVKTLKFSAIYGANAAGKSNLIKAIAFGKDLITSSLHKKSIDFSPHKLCIDSQKSHSRLEYEIQHNGKNYAYGFIFNRNEIKEEWLYELKKTTKNSTWSETLIFNRSDVIKYEWGPNIEVNEGLHERLKFLGELTPHHQLLLANIASKSFLKLIENDKESVKSFLDVIDWFQNALTVVYPETTKDVVFFELYKNNNLKNIFAKFFKYFDTGIEEIDFEDVDFDEIKMPSSIKEKIREDFSDPSSEKEVGFAVDEKKQIFMFTRSEDHSLEIKAQTLVTKHKLINGELINFNPALEESDGTLRLFYLIPWLIDLIQGDNVIVIDELERSLHANLVYAFIEFYLRASSKAKVNSQLIISTHESSILTQELLRKDEIWFATKTKQGGTKLNSLEEYKVRQDKELMRSYLIGRFRAIPNIGSSDYLTDVLANEDGKK